MKWRVVIEGECSGTLGPLMIRYNLFHCRFFTISLHNFLRSDAERHLHDHPWSFVTLILWGGYWEHTPSGRTWNRPGSILYRPAEWQHKVEVNRPAWTLIFRTADRREWGFITPDGWVHWVVYFRNPKLRGCAE